MFTTIISALSGLASLIGTGFKQYQERKVAEHDVIKAELEAKKELALDREKAELELGKLQVRASSPWFKHFTFFMWFGPFVVTTIFPDHGVKMFENWRLMPEWYAQSCVALMFIIWGVQVGKDYVSNIFSSAGQFFSRKQELSFNRKILRDTLKSSSSNIGLHEVEIYEKAINASQNAKPKSVEFNNKIFFDSIRKDAGSLTQEQVDLLNKALNKAKDS